VNPRLIFLPLIHELIFKNMEQLLGAHTSTAGGVSKSIERAEKLGFTAIQIFTKNNNRWFQKQLDEKEISKFRINLKNSNIKFVVSHDSYLINLCAKDKSILRKSREAFLDELTRCEQLGIPYLNFHPGSHLGAGEKEGIKLIVESLNIIHNKTKHFKVSSMLEATAGAGTAIGYRFEQLREIIDLVDNKKRMSVCIDTAHIFAAGYDIKNLKNYKKVIKEFDEIIGLERLKCFHMNDSKKELGSRRDRHEHIGKGFIGKDGFANIMNDKRLKNIPKILETPKGKQMKEDIRNLKTLLSLIK
jgi:deoxyribonuclease-4